jgi:hypothetical protein
VKCDETKPDCFRCTSTGRRCDGYPSLKARSKAEDLSLTGSCKLNTTGYHESEARALDFFRHVAGPVLSGQFNCDFWTRLVAQLSHREPAVRHALIAISSLYEHGTQSQFAVRHYNAAIQKMVSASDETLASFMAVLFICVEFLQGNAAAAIAHCRHGILVFNNSSTSSAWAREYLLPIFSRMSIFPFFFGSDVSTFPQLDGLCTLISTSFSSVTDAQTTLHALVTRSIRFVRSGDKYRLGPLRHSPIPHSLREEQDSIQNSLDDWQLAFSEFNAEHGHAGANAPGFPILQMTYLVCKIWVSEALDRDETAYDRHLDRFRCIVALASQMETPASNVLDKSSRPKFIFEMGFMPLLYFVVIKCRSLEIRLAALECMRTLAVSREGLWEVSTMYLVGRRLIEVENSAILTTQSSLTSFVDMPPEEKRVRECLLSPDMDIHYNENGERICRRRITYILWKPSNELYAKNEWITVSSERSIGNKMDATHLAILSRFASQLQYVLH